MSHSQTVWQLCADFICNEIKNSFPVTSENESHFSSLHRRMRLFIQDEVPTIVTIHMYHQIRHNDAELRFLYRLSDCRCITDISYDILDSPQHQFSYYFFILFLLHSIKNDSVLTDDIPNILSTEHNYNYCLNKCWDLVSQCGFSMNREDDRTNDETIKQFKQYAKILRERENNGTDEYLSTVRDTILEIIHESTMRETIVNESTNH